MRGLVLVALIAGCGSKAAAPTPVKQEVKKEAGSGSGSGSAAMTKAKKKHEKAPATAEQKQTYKDKMKAGWAAQKAKKWADAVPEFEAALVAIPADQRALAELGWSAMNAGDYKKAREADEQAVAIAVDTKVKASALYNLGKVKEKTQDKDGALKAYVASLALRPNKVVEQAVGALGADAKQLADAPKCTAGLEPCGCLQEILTGDPKSDVADCALDPAGAKTPGFSTYSINVPHGSDEYLFDDAKHVLTQVSTEYDHGETYRETTTDKIERRKVGAHDILWISKTVHDEEIDLNGDTETNRSITGTSVTICVLDKVPRCPFEDLPQTRTVDAGGKVATRELAIDVAADGTMTIKLVGGASNEETDALLGPHKLW